MYLHIYLQRFDLFEEISFHLYWQANAFSWIGFVAVQNLSYWWAGTDIVETKSIYFQFA